jgi:hypothetical protein
MPVSPGCHTTYQAGVASSSRARVSVGLRFFGSLPTVYCSAMLHHVHTARLRALSKQSLEKNQCGLLPHGTLPTIPD